MKILKGTGNTFSTSRKRWVPWKPNPKAEQRGAKIARLKAKGFLPPGDKASLRLAAEQAAREHPIKRA